MGSRRDFDIYLASEKIMNGLPCQLSLPIADLTQRPYLILNENLKDKPEELQKILEWAEKEVAEHRQMMERWAAERASGKLPKEVEEALENYQRRLGVS